MMEVIQRVLPQTAQEHVPRLDDALDTVDSTVFRNVPVKKLPETDRLGLRIGVLRVDADGGTESELDTFSATLRAAIERQTYRTGAAA
jgi:hypothetical protein